MLNAGSLHCEPGANGDPCMDRPVTMMPVVTLGLGHSF